MIYLSKGIVQKNSTEQLLFVAHCGQVFQLTGAEAAVWLNGRFAFAVLHSEMEVPALKHLAQMGLAEMEPEDSSWSRYRVLTRCICCPAQYAKPELLSRKEKWMLQWLRNAGIRLSTAELVYLQEHEIMPAEEYFYPGNRQALIEEIYTKDTIADNLLEQQMEKADCRDEVVCTLMKLLAKKKIILL